MITMYDTIPDSVGQIPADAQAVAGYVDGWYVSFPLLVERFASQAHCLSIAVHPNDDAACLDVEPGDATVGDAPAWVDRQLARGQWRPCVYASQSSWEDDGLYGLLAGYETRIRRWVAAYPGTGANVPSGYDAHQYADVGPHGENYDTSVCRDDFFPSKPTPPPDPHHYQWFFDQPFNTGRPWGKINERQVVLHYDGARAHWIRYRAYLNHVLRPQLRALAGRVYTVAHEQPDPNGKPSWDRFHRGWRFQQLIQRSQGKRFA